jgi:hypothetical protein
VATNKQVSTRGAGKGQRLLAGSRDQLLKNLKRVHKLFPDANPDRDFYRAHGKYADSAWKVYFPHFRDFVKAAEIAPPKPDSIITVAQEISVADKLDFELQKLSVKKDGNKKLLEEAK